MNHIYTFLLLGLAASINIRVNSDVSNDHQVLAPLASKGSDLPQALLVLIPGAYIETSYYLEPMK